MFSVFLPKLLEGRGGITDDVGSGGGARSVADSLWDVVIYAIGGCPGAIVRTPFIPLQIERAVTSRVHCTARCISGRLADGPPRVPRRKHLYHRNLLRDLRPRPATVGRPGQLSGN